MLFEAAIFELLGKFTVRVVVDVVVIFATDENQQIIMAIFIESVNDQMMVVHGADR